MLIYPPRRASLMLATLALAGILLGGCASKLEKARDQGVKLYQENQFDQSLASLKTALSYDQFDAVANTYAGLIHYRAGNLEQAAYHFKIALQSDPSSEEAKDGLTATLIKMNKPDLALDALERSAALAEKVEDPRWKKSNVKRPYHDQITENLYVNKIDDRIRIGRAYEKLGDYDNAVLFYKKALQLTPRSTSAMLSLANLYLRVGNKEQAREYLARAYKIDPATPGLTDAMTQSGLSISQVLAPPPAASASNTMVPAPR